MPVERPSMSEDQPGNMGSIGDVMGANVLDSETYESVTEDVHRLSLRALFCRDWEAE